MNLKLDQDKCISCGFCVSSYPTVFGWDDNGKAEAFSRAVNTLTERALEEVADCCPGDAIEIWE